MGSILVPKLLTLGYDVTVYDLMIYGSNVLEEHPNLKKIKGDIRDLSLIKKSLNEYRYNIIIQEEEKYIKMISFMYLETLLRFVDM